MGWTTYRAIHYKNGKVDRKAEMDEYYNWETYKKKVSVLKSSMVGSTYYAAVQVMNKKSGERTVVAAVCLTSTRTYDGMNFGYKNMDETMGPYESKCPKGILDLLTPTDNECALAWRARCRDYIQKKKEKKTKGTLPVGSVIRFTRFDGKVIELEKMKPAYQFRRPWFYRAEDNTYYPVNRIPDDFEIVKEA